jgi:hypothetical protein
LQISSTNLLVAAQQPQLAPARRAATSTERPPANFEPINFKAQQSPNKAEAPPQPIARTQGPGSLLDIRV